MLKDTFYTVLSFEQAEQTIQARIKLNAQHPIFEGHFPQHPIVPGVCMVQLVKELLELSVEKSLMLTYGDNLKFLTMLNPQEVPEVNVSITYKLEDLITIQATIQQNDVTYFKFSGTVKKTD